MQIRYRHGDAPTANKNGANQTGGPDGRTRRDDQTGGPDGRTRLGAKVADALSKWNLVETGDQRSSVILD